MNKEEKQNVNDETFDKEYEEWKRQEEENEWACIRHGNETTFSYPEELEELQELQEIDFYKKVRRLVYRNLFYIIKDLFTKAVNDNEPESIADSTIFLEIVAKETFQEMKEIIMVDDEGNDNEFWWRTLNDNDEDHMKWIREHSRQNAYYFIELMRENTQ